MSFDNLRQSARPWLWRLVAGGLIVGSLIARLVYLAFFCPLDLAPDEAHYWDWSRHLDWSYYSKGPLVAYLIRLSCSVFGNEMIAVRLPAVICGSLLLVSLYVLTVQVFRRESLACGVVVLFLTLPLFAVGSTLMTIDAPFLCCWGWALVAGHRALFPSPQPFSQTERGVSSVLSQGERGFGNYGAFVLLGFLVGLGILAKYTMVLFLPALALFCLATPGYRHHLIRPGLWIAVGIAGVCSLPIVIWNAQHGWVTLLHTRGHAGLDEQGLEWQGPLTYIGLQCAVLLGFWFVAWVRAVIELRPGRASEGCHAHAGPSRDNGTTRASPAWAWHATSYLWWLSAPVFGFFLLFSVKNGGGEANWPVAAYLSGLILSAAWIAKQLESPRAWYRRLIRTGIVATCGTGFLLIVLLHDTRLIHPFLAELAGAPSDTRPFPLRRLDPTCRLRGWRTLAAAIDRLRNELGGEPVLAGAGWNLPGEIGFYCRDHPPVYSIGPALGDRHSQYDFWRPNPVSDAEHFAGKTFIIVAGDPISLEGAFESVDPPRLIHYQENGRPIARWALMVGRGFRGFRYASFRHDEY